MAVFYSQGPIFTTHCQLTYRVPRDLLSAILECYVGGWMFSPLLCTEIQYQYDCNCTVLAHGCFLFIGPLSANPCLLLPIGYPGDLLSAILLSVMFCWMLASAASVFINQYGLQLYSAFLLAHWCFLFTGAHSSANPCLPASTYRAPRDLP
jgi:hypothetical protein